MTTAPPPSNSNWTAVGPFNASLVIGASDIDQLPLELIQDYEDYDVDSEVEKKSI